MFYRFVLILILLLPFIGGPLQLAAAQRAQVGQEKTAEASHATADVERQKRRAGLREELRGQNAARTPAPQRQLSPEDRADLRQQLRQQPRQTDRDDKRQ